MILFLLTTCCFICTVIKFICICINHTRMFDFFFFFFFFFFFCFTAAFLVVMSSGRERAVCTPSPPEAMQGAGWREPSMKARFTLRSWRPHAALSLTTISYLGWTEWGA